MADETTNYGYASDEAKVVPYHFGLNAGVTFMTKFRWIPNGGKDGGEQEALDIAFNINGAEKSYRMFPVTKAFLKGGGETTDRNSKEFKDTLRDFNARMTHIMSCFIDREAYIAATSRHIADFKAFCNLVAGLLPKNYADRKLDIFLQYQYQPSPGQTRTFLEIPKKMTQGYWLCPAMVGNWVEKRVDNPSDTLAQALWYEDKDTPLNEKGEARKHLFIKNGWFLNHGFAVPQGVDTSKASTNGANTASQPLPEQGKAAAW